MGYLLLAVGVAFVLMWGGLQVSKANAARWQTRATTAESANVSLAASIKGVKAQCQATAGTIAAQAKADADKRAKAKAALAARDKAKATDAPKIQNLEAALADTTPTTPEADCAAAGKILDEYAVDARAADKATPVKK